MGFCTSWAVDRLGRGPEWLDVIYIDLHIPNLPASFREKRVIHLSDFHFSRTVSARYLKHCIERVNTLDADIILLTGDYVTHDMLGRFQRRAFEMLGELQSRHGVYACLGNHDYGPDGFGGRGNVHGNDPGKKHDGSKHKPHRRAGHIVDGLTGQGIVVLRNRHFRVEIDGEDLWLVGLGDLWAGDLKPATAFANVPGNRSVIVMAHNPRAVNHLGDFTFDAIVSGHTHGKQIKWSSSSGRWTLKKRRFHSGLYDLGNAKLYVNRGLGRLGSLSFSVRPEITVLTLR
jgi:predicted MPP superfamily phosphohydrolase